MPNTQITTMSGRTLEEVKAGIRMRMRNMVFNALEIGNDLIEAKEACGHGQWLPFLRDVGFSASTAANYMRIAKEVGSDSRMAQLPYTKILAVLAAPPEEREELAAAAEDMSAAEIRRLTDERNRAVEAANVETSRADQAEEALRKSEADAKEFYDRNASLRTQIQNLEAKLDRKEDEMQRLLRQCDEEAREEEREKLQEEIDALRGKLIEAENNVIEVEVIPADYEQLKRKQRELLDAAAEAEERAAAAEAELEEARAENAQNGVSEYEKMHFAMKTFLMQCELMACRPEGLLRDMEKVRRDVERLRMWCDSMTQAMNVHVVEGAVV